MAVTKLIISGANKNSTSCSSMIYEESDRYEKKKMSRFCKACLALALILLIGALFTVSFVVQWYNAQKLEKTVSNELSEMRAEWEMVEEEMEIYSENNEISIAYTAEELDESITKNEKMNKEIWGEISNLRAGIETLTKNASFVSNATEKMMAYLFRAFSANAKQLEDNFVPQINTIQTVISKWQNGNMKALHKNNISKLVELLVQEEECAATRVAHNICPINKIDARNRWDAENYGKDATFSTDGLTVRKTQTVPTKYTYTNVRAEQPLWFNFSTGQLNDDKCCLRQFYFEVLVKDMGGSSYPNNELVIGLAGPRFVHSSGVFDQYPYPYGIGSHGSCIEGGYLVRHGRGFKAGDTVGCGLLRTPNGQFRVFYTKNGQFHVNPSELFPSHLKLNPLLYPIVMLEHQGANVEANFGADLEKKPFKFNMTEHSTYILKDIFGKWK